MQGAICPHALISVQYSIVVSACISHIRLFKQYKLDDFPNASVSNFANIGDFINTFIGDILLVLTTIASLAMLTAAIVAWGATRVRPLEVLRYE